MIYCLSKPIKEQWYANANVFFIISSMNSHTRKTYVNSTNKLAITNEYSSDRYTMQNQNIRIPNQLTRNAKPSSFNNEPSENAIDMQQLYTFIYKIQTKYVFLLWGGGGGALSFLRGLTSLLSMLA